MTTNNNEVYTVETLPSDVSYVIPIYQRLFEWGEEQIKKLLDDLIEAFEAHSKKPYYIGAITIVERKYEDKQKYWEIVDGQQRLTFLSLFGAMCCKGNGDWNDFLYTNETLPHFRMKYIGRDADEKDLSAIAKGEIDNIHNQNMLCFTKCYNDFMSDKKANIVDFSEFVRTKATFMRSVLRSEYSNHELNMYFERLNVTGRQLEPQELVKSLYFSDKADLFNNIINFTDKYEGGSSNTKKTSITLKYILDENIENLYYEITQNSKDTSKKKCNCFSEGLYKEPTKNSATSNIRAIFSESTFLLHVLRLTSREKISLDQDKLLKMFKEKYKKEQQSNFLEKMEAYREWLDEKIIYISENGFEFRSQIQKDNANKKEQEDLTKLLQYQSMLTVSSPASQEWVLKAYIESGGNSLSFEHLKKIDSRPLPELVDMRYGKIDRYWFWKLDYLLWETCFNKQWNKGSEINIAGYNFKFTKKEFGAIKNYSFKENRSIEHLHPQTAENQWQDNYLHSFGNLAMISSSFNSAQGNDGVATKFGRLTDRIDRGQHLESIKLLLMFKLASDSESNWTPKMAEEHGEAMYHVLSAHYIASLKKHMECNFPSSPFFDERFIYITF